MFKSLFCVLVIVALALPQTTLKEFADSTGCDTTTILLKGDTNTALRNNGRLIRRFPNPSDSQAFIAALTDISSLRYVRTPTQWLINNVLRENGMALQYFPAATKRQMMIACRQNGIAIRYIDSVNQDDSIQVAAVKDNGNALTYIKSPCDSAKWWACKRLGCSLLYIDSAHQTVQLCSLACLNDGYALQYVYKQTENIRIRAIVSEPYAIQFCDTITIALAKMAVRRNIACVKWIDPKIFTGTKQKLQSLRSGGK